MKITDVLNEARRNPEQNPKVSAYKQIQRICNNLKVNSRIDMRNCFVSFTSLDKLGLNPQSKYNTPIGIYAYPGDYVLKTVGSKEAMQELPFAGDEPYVNIFQAAGNIVNLKNITPSMEDDFNDKITHYIRKHFPHINIEIVSNIIERSHSESRVSDIPGGRFWYVTLEVSKLISQPLRTKDMSNPFASASYIRTTTIIEWNKLFRSIGIDGIIDPGLSIIHISEPVQAVFFSIKAVRNVKRVYNKYAAFIQHINSISEQEQIDAIYNDPSDVRYIKNPSEAVQLHVVEIDPTYIQFIKKPSINVQQTVLNMDIRYAAFIPEISEKIQQWLVKQDPTMIADIQNPSLSVQQFILDKYPKYLPHLKKVDPIIVKAAKQRGIFTRIG